MKTSDLQRSILHKSPFNYDWPEDKDAINWKNFSSVQYHCRLKDGRLRIVPQMFSNKGTNHSHSVYAFDKMGDVISSSARAVENMFNPNPEWLGRTTTYVMRCGPPVASEFYLISIFESESEP